MRLTRQSTYAIRTLVYCAVNAPGLSRIADVAEALGISKLFLFKLIKPLVENGLIETVRGRKGGSDLLRPLADSRTIADLADEHTSLSRRLGLGLEEPGVLAAH